jgi:hypothetical protein
MTIFLFWIGLAIIVGVGANTRGRNGPGWGLLAVVISPLLAGFLLFAMPRRQSLSDIATLAMIEATPEDSRSRQLLAEHEAKAARKATAHWFWGHNKHLSLTTNNKSFYTGVTVWFVFLCIVGIGIIRKPVASPAAPSISTTQPLTPNVNDPRWVKDFTRRVIEACERLPVGHLDRPSEVICGAPR